MSSRSSEQGNAVASLRARPRRGHLLAKFLQYLLPMFLLLAIPGIGYIVHVALRADRDVFAARIGNRVARTASTLSRYDSDTNSSLARDLIAPLTDDRAILCVEYQKSGKIIAGLPTPTGCGVDKEQGSVSVTVGKPGDGLLRVHYSDAELSEARQLQQVLAASVVGVAFLLALLTAATGFQLIVAKPMRALLTSIRARLATGQWQPVGKSYDHELGEIIDAFDAMMVREAEHERQMLQASERLLAKKEALAQLNQTLEQRVSERTAELKIEMERAEAASQAKSRFLWSMSHELRTPLNAIIGFSELMEKGVLGPIGNDRYAEYVCDILASAQHLLAIINGILTVAKIEAGVETLVETETDGLALLAECLRFIQPMAERAGICVTQSSRLIGLRLTVDEPRLKQVILNLLSNAVKFNNVGGGVALSTTLSSSGDLNISVRDTGIGMAPEQIPVALKEFGQIENAFSREHDGVGLGLYLANKLICLHGGALHIESLLGHGTTVTISLPARRVCVEGNSKQPTISSTVTPALPKETCGTHVNEQAAVRHSLQ